MTQTREDFLFRVAYPRKMPETLHEGHGCREEGAARESASKTTERIALPVHVLLSKS